MLRNRYVLFEEETMVDQNVPLTAESTSGSNAKWNKVIFLVLFMQICMGLTCLKTVPRLYMDEAWDSSLGYVFSNTGVIRHPFLEGFGGMEVHFIQPRILQPLFSSVIFKVAGYSITTSRLGSLFFGVLAIVCLYGIMRKWFGEKQAVFICIATVINPWFFEISRRARPEIYYAALALAVLWCVVHAIEKNSRITAFSAGVLSALSSLAHPSGFVMSIAIIIAVLLWLRTRTLWQLILWAGLGFVIAMLPYFIYVAFCTQDPAVDFMQQMQNGSIKMGFLTGETMRWKNFLQWPKGIPLLAIFGVSCIAGFYRSTAADKSLVTIIFVYALITPFASVNNAGRYLACLTPLFAALIIRFVWRISFGKNLFPGKWRKTRLTLAFGTVAAYTLFSVAGISLLFYRLAGADFDNVVDNIATVVDKDSSVYGEKMLWWGHNSFHYGPFTADYTVQPWQQTIEMVRKHRFDYAVRSAWTFGTSHGIAKAPDKMPDFRPNYMVDQVCMKYGTKIHEFYDPYFGAFEVYKLDWYRNPD